MTQLTARVGKEVYQVIFPELNWARERLAVDLDAVLTQVGQICHTIFLIPFEFTVYGPSNKTKKKRGRHINTLAHGRSLRYLRFHLSSRLVTALTNTADFVASKDDIAIYTKKRKTIESWLERYCALRRIQHEEV